MVDRQPKNKQREVEVSLHELKTQTHSHEFMREKICNVQKACFCGTKRKKTTRNSADPCVGVAISKRIRFRLGKSEGVLNRFPKQEEKFFFRV